MRHVEIDLSKLLGFRLVPQPNSGRIGLKPTLAGTKMGGKPGAKLIGPGARIGGKVGKKAL